MKDANSKKLCQICIKIPSKYRCPSCYLLYCSLACFKSHKENLCESETNKRKKQQDQIKRETSTSLDEQSSDDDNSYDEDRLKSSDLKKLEHSEVLKSMLKNKDIREMITNIDSSHDPEIKLNDSMQEPLFAEFVNHCLSVVEPNQETNVEIKH